MNRWYLAQLAGGVSLEDVALIDLQVSQGENHAAAGLVVFQDPEAGLYQQLVTGRNSCACSTRISTGEHMRPRVWISAPSLKSCVESRGRPEQHCEPSMPRGRDMEHARARVLPKELRALYEHLQARILEIIESLDTLRAGPEIEIFHEVEQDESAIERVTATQQEELESEITGLKTEAEQAAEEARELAGEVPF